MAGTCEANEPHPLSYEKALFESNRLPTLLTSSSNAEDGSADAALDLPKPSVPYPVHTPPQASSHKCPHGHHAGVATDCHNLPSSSAAAYSTLMCRTNSSVLTIIIHVLFQAVSPPVSPQRRIASAVVRSILLLTLSIPWPVFASLSANVITQLC